MLISFIDYIKKENCTAEVIEPLIVGIKVAVNDGLVKINALAGASVDVILASAVDVNVKLDVHAVASIVADLIVVSILFVILSSKNTH